ncbi:RNA methyltransferase [Prochlorococcus marinus]|uniref:RNA methyltransferase n=1 Tax=Prochlorococcus marinus TaxID=1219 RepID=UPI00031BD6F0|nr:RNA methyltransferase [Prochlorococcus marinus]
MKKNVVNLKVVLVEPNGPINIGSIARLCSNFDVNELRIVSPKCDIFSLEAKKMALKGQKYINNCRVFNSIEQAIFDCDLVLATCGRIDLSNDIECENPEVISKWISSFKVINNLAILFGREDRGLTNSELLFAHKIFNIKTSQDYPSLNLSHAVAIILYELNKCSKNTPQKDLKVFNLASSKQIYESFKDLEEILIRTGYLLEHTSFSKISKFKKFILKAKTSSHEINVLRGIVRQIKWFLNNSKGN